MITMKNLRIILFLYSCYANPISCDTTPDDTNELCQTAIILGQNTYIQENLATIVGTPADMSIDNKSGDIFFVNLNDLSIGQSRMTIRVLKSGETSPEIIKLSGSGQATAVDNDNGVVYLATSKGLYTFDRRSNSVTPFSAAGEDVMYVDVADKGKSVYIATWPDKAVEKITDEGKVVEQFVNIPNGKGLTIDKGNNIFFINNDMPYVLKKLEKRPIKIEGLDMNPKIEFSVDKTGKVYALNTDSDFYEINLNKNEAELIGNLGFEYVNTFAFDNDDNIIVGKENGLVKFSKKSGKLCQ